jgi:exonuclease I
MTTLELAREIAARSVPRAFLYFFRHRDRQFKQEARP